MCFPCILSALGTARPGRFTCPLWYISHKWRRGWWRRSRRGRLIKESLSLWWSSNWKIAAQGSLSKQQRKKHIITKAKLCSMYVYGLEHSGDRSPTARPRAHPHVHPSACMSAHLPFHLSDFPLARLCACDWFVFSKTLPDSSSQRQAESSCLGQADSSYLGQADLSYLGLNTCPCPGAALTLPRRLPYELCSLF